MTNIPINVDLWGWGPDMENSKIVNSCLGYINKYPFKPSMKPDRLGRMCDFTFSTFQRNRDNKYGPDGSGGNFGLGSGAGMAGGAGGANSGAYFMDDDSKFQTVDTRATQKSKGMNRYGGYNRKIQRQTTQAYNQKQLQEKSKLLGHQKRALQKKQVVQQLRNQRPYGRSRTFTEWSVEPTPEWVVETEIQLNQLRKRHIDSNKIVVKDLCWRGEIRFYNKQMDRITPKNQINLQSFSNSLDFYWVSTSDDAIMSDQILKSCNDEQNNDTNESQESKNASNNVVDSSKDSSKVNSDQKQKKIVNESPSDIKIQVAVTDQILSYLMAASQSKYSWHIYINKIEGKLIFDKADGSIVDLLTVNETATEPPVQDDPNKFNRPPALGFEAVKINQNFRQQVLVKDAVPVEKYGNAPFVEKDDNPAGIAYRYRLYTLPGKPNSSVKFERENVTLLTRAEVHGKIQSEDSDEYVFICALNEYDLKSRKNWRNQIEAQKGALFATEIRNNANKLQKWVACAMIGGCNHLKLGYVSRMQHNCPDNHCILSIQSYKTHELGQQLELKPDNAWGIIRFIIDLMMGKPDGRYVVLKDPIKPIMRIYRRPDDEDDAVVEEDGHDESDEVGVSEEKRQESFSIVDKSDEVSGNDAVEIDIDENLNDNLKSISLNSTSNIQNSSIGKDINGSTKVGNFNNTSMMDHTNNNKSS